MGRGRHSIMWDYFESTDDIQRMARCHLCQKILSYKSTTNNLKTHLKHVHMEAFTTIADSTDSTNSAAQENIELETVYLVSPSGSSETVQVQAETAHHDTSETPNKESRLTKPRPSVRFLKRKRNLGDEQSLAYHFKREKETEAVTKVWAQKLEKLTLDQRRFAEKFISEIFFEAEMGNLSRQCSFSTGPIYDSLDEHKEF